MTNSVYYNQAHTHTQKWVKYVSCSGQKLCWCAFLYHKMYLWCWFFPFLLKLFFFQSSDSTQGKGKNSPSYQARGPSGRSTRPQAWCADWSPGGPHWLYLCRRRQAESKGTNFWDTSSPNGYHKTEMKRPIRFQQWFVLYSLFILMCLCIVILIQFSD